MRIDAQEAHLSRAAQRLAAQARLYARRDLALPTDLEAALLQEGIDPRSFSTDTAINTDH
jgi:hypothetical protein